MKQYIDLVTDIIKFGQIKTDRTGTGTISTFGHKSEYDLREGFPLLTLKSTHPRSVFIENFWFLSGDTNIKFLNENKVKIWNEWADEDGNLGPVYGKQWVNWGGHKEYIRLNKTSRKVGNEHVMDVPGINQIENAIQMLKTNPDDRGIIVSAWNVADLEKMALRPCHALFQFYTEEITNYQERYLLFNSWAKRENIDFSGMSAEDAMEHYNFPKRYIDLQLYQRSCDVFLGAPFNIAGYSLILSMIGSVVNMIPRKFVHSFGDAHIYLNHKDQVNQLLNRTRQEDENIDFFKFKDKVKENIGEYMGPDLPMISIPKKDSIWDYKYEDVKLLKYEPLSVIKAPIAV